MHGGDVKEDVNEFFRDLKKQNNIEETIEELIKKKAVFDEDGKLIDLNLFNMNIQVLPDSILSLNIMGKLMLSNNPITTLPENFDSIKLANTITYTYNDIKNEKVRNMFKSINSSINSSIQKAPLLSFEEQQKKNNWDRGIEIENAKKERDAADKVRYAEINEEKKQTLLGDDYIHYVTWKQEKDRLTNILASPHTNQHDQSYKDIQKLISKLDTKIETLLHTAQEKKNKEYDEKAQERDKEKKLQIFLGNKYGLYTSLKQEMDGLTLESQHPRDQSAEDIQKSISKLDTQMKTLLRTRQEEVDQKEKEQAERDLHLLGRWGTQN